MNLIRNKHYRNEDKFENLFIINYREDVTVVDYTVQRSDDEAVENLRSPKRVDLERSLSTVGKTLYSKAPAPPPEEVRHWFYIQHV